MDSLTYIFFVSILAMAFLFIQVIIVRWAFRIDTQVKNQNAMIFLLARLCEKANVSETDIESITKYFGVKGFKKSA
jgi:hypothetical protein